MKLSWLFGSSMEAHHLLWVYLSVWIIQGGYLAWIAWQWRHIDVPADGLDSETPEDF
jgi:threonine/homoserine/homoserine lactone efflux protein